MGREQLVRPGSCQGLVDGANMVLMATSLSWVPFPTLATDLDLQQTLRRDRLAGKGKVSSLSSQFTHSGHGSQAITDVLVQG